MTTTPISQQPPFFPFTPPKPITTRPSSPVLPSSNGPSNKDSDLQQITSYRNPNQGSISYYFGTHQEDRPYCIFEHEFVLANEDPSFARTCCATQESLVHKRVVNVIADNNHIHGICKTRFYLMKDSRVGDPNSIAIHEPLSHRCFHAEGTYKCARMGQIFFVDPRTRTIAKYPHPVVSLKNRDDLSPEQSGIPIELKLMKKFMNQRGVAQYLGTYDYTSLKGRVRQVLIMQYYNQGSLEYLLKKASLNPPAQPQLHILENKRADLILDCLYGLEAIHDQGMTHRDVKPANIFINLNSDATVTGVLGDFNFMKSRFSTGNTGDIFAHTPYYSSPEFMDFYLRKTTRSWAPPKEQNDDLSASVFAPGRDIWALGVSCLLLLNEQEKPQALIEYIFKSKDLNTLIERLAEFYQTEELKAFDSKGFLFPEPVTKNSFAHIVWEMLNPNPDTRISAKKAREKWEACMMQQANPELTPNEQRIPPSIISQTIPEIAPPTQGANTPIPNEQTVPLIALPTQGANTPIPNEQTVPPTVPEIPQPNQRIAQKRGFLPIRTTGLGEPL